MEKTLPPERYYKIRLDGSNITDDQIFLIEGHVLRGLLQAACRLNDGMKLDANQRRDLAQRMQALLEQAVLHEPRQS